jgi:phage tail sheath gpL-like
MATPIQAVRITGKTAGSDLTNKLAVLANVSIANAFRNIGAWFESIGIGTRLFNGFVHVGGTQATNTVTFSSFADGDTLTINGVVLTGKTTVATANQFQLGATDAGTAANLVYYLANGKPSVSSTLGAPGAKVWGVVTGVAASNVVTLTAQETGAIGNLYTLAISAHGSVGGANFSSGADGTIIALAKGI